MQSIWNFLVGKFSKMPPWVQILSYLVVLALCVYLYLVPRFANGQIVAVKKSGGFIPYRGIDLQTHVEGRILKFRTNEAGYWSIPVVSRLPTSIRLQVFHEDDKCWHPVELSWAALWSKEFRIEVKNDPPEMILNVVSLKPFQSLKTLIASVFLEFLPNNIQAAELKLPTKILSPTMRPVTSAGTESEIRVKVSATVGKVIGKAANRVTPSFAFNGKGAPTYIQRIQIVEHLERDFNLKIPDEHWRALKSVGELADYVYKRKVLEQSKPEIFRSKRDFNWPVIQQSVPVEQRPIFKR